MRYWRGLLLIFATWGVYFLVLWPKMLFWQKDGLYAGWIGVWADWAVHFSYASVFAYRPVTDWFIGHPLFHGRTQFTYPFVADAISGLLIRSGVDVVLAFLVPSILTTFALLTALFYVYRHFLPSARQTLLAVTLFLTSGGIGWWFFLQDLWENPSLETLRFPPEQYTHIGSLTIEWINVVTAQILPQRAFLLGLSITVFILLMLMRWGDRCFRVSKMRIVGLGLLAGVLPIVHVHSFLALMILCAVFLFMGIRHWRSWVVFAHAAAIPALLLYWFFFREVGNGFIQWYPGWLAQSKNINWVYFWWLNWGIFLPFALFATWRTKLYRHPLVVGGIVIFILGNLFLFQPYDWDNSKLLTYSYLILSIPTMKYLVVLWKHGKLTQISAVALFVVMIASGSLDLWRVLQTDKLLYRMWTNEELALAQQFREISNPTDRVLVSDQHNHWISTHTGRPVLLGYKGWMWTYGIDYTATDRDMKIMFAGGTKAEELFDQYNIKYVVIGPSELFDYHANREYFDDVYPVVLKDSTTIVYRI